MIAHILDTDTVSLFQRGHAVVCNNVQVRPWISLAVTVITVEEQLRGWYDRLRKTRNNTDLARAYQRLTDTAKFFGQIEILSFPKSTIDRYELLRRQVQNVGKNDLRIAAIAIENGATLVTRNLRDFSRVPGLAVEDWSC
jgi:tRNA(fMet)-specific endonuclease VapC